MRIITSKSGATVLSRKHMDFLLQVDDASLPQVKEVKFLGVFFTRKWWSVRSIGESEQQVRRCHRSL